MNLEIAGIIGPLTPIGGVFFIGGWIMIVMGGYSAGRLKGHNN
jgi:uncharacterized membrane protein YgdD (TMEM256/DUF423 family)